MKNVCVVGYGAIGPVHAEAISHINSANLYAVCDCNPEALDKCKAKYDIATYSDFDDMLKDEKVDSVHICTPHYLHYEMIKKALQCGKNVVCEKPVTRTPEEFEALLKIPKANEICVVLQNRYNHSIVKLKKLIDDGVLGNIKAIKGMVTWHRTKEYYENATWRGKWATEGGSALLNQSVHTLDLMIYLLGAIKGLRANIHNYTLEDVIETEDTVTAYLIFDKGFSGLFYATNAYDVDSAPEIEIVGDKGVARYLYKKLILDDRIIAEDTPVINGKSYWGSGHEALLRDYYENNVFLTPKDVENTMKTVFSVYDSAKNNGIKIDLY